MKAKHSELSKHIAALQGIEEWRVEAVQLDHVRVGCCCSIIDAGWVHAGAVGQAGRGP